MGGPERFALHIDWGSWALPLAVHTQLSRHRDWWAISIQILPMCFIISWGPAFRTQKVDA